MSATQPAQAPVQTQPIPVPARTEPPHIAVQPGLPPDVAAQFELFQRASAMMARAAHAKGKLAQLERTQTTLLRASLARLPLELDWLVRVGSGWVDTRELLQYTCRELPTARSI